MHTSQCEENSLRLVPSHLSALNLYLTEGDLEDFYFINDEIHRGRVEVCVNETWGSVCYNELWGDDEATVVCTQLGFSPFGENMHTYVYWLLKLLVKLSTLLHNDNDTQLTFSTTHHFPLLRCYWCKSRVSWPHSTNCV